MSPSNDQAALELAITEAALELIEATGAASIAALLEPFPGHEEVIADVLDALGVYSTQVQHDRGVVRSSATAELLEPGQRLGDFVIVGELGRGGMGVVYRAKQQSLGGREVALKVLRPALVARDPRFLERFQREAALAADVHDAHVAEVFDYGEERGLVFFAMQLVEGRAMNAVLKDLAREHRLGSSRHQTREYVRHAAALLRELAMGVAALHARGLVHRDVKPSNVVLEGFAEGDLFEALFEAHPVLIDFGLLRPVVDSGLTGSQTMLGTLGFASPEAKLGREVDARTDVFGLGAILHDLLALTPPGDRDPATAGLSDVRTLNPAVDERLSAIVRMALDERRELRYADGAALADELERYLDGRAIAALPTSPWLRLRLWMRRDPGHAALVLAGIAVAFVAALVLVWGGVALASAAGVAREAEHRQERGELAEAAGALHEVAAQAKLIGLLPGFSNQLDLAADLERLQAEHLAADLTGQELGPGEMSLAQVLVNIEAGDRTSYQLAHDRCLMLLLTPGYEALAPQLLAFLTRELKEDRPPWRRLMAVESAAQLSICDPFVLDAGEPLPAGYRELADGLIATVHSNVASETLRYSFSALGGFGSDHVFDALLRIDQHLGGEAQRVRLRALRRIFYLRNAGGKQLDDTQVAAWARLSWSILTNPKSYIANPIDEGRPWTNGVWISNGAHFSDLCDEIIGAGIEGFTAFAFVRYQAELRGELERVRALDAIEQPVIFRRMIDHNVAAQQARDRGAELPETWLLAEALTGNPPLRGFTAILPFVITRGHLRRQPVFEPELFDALLNKLRDFRFENIWDQSTPAHVQSLVAEQTSPADTNGALSFEAGQLRLSGTASGVRWFAAELLDARSDAKDGCLEFRAPRRAWLELTLALPEHADRALVTINHHMASRSPLPFGGTSEARVTFNGCSTHTLPVIGTAQASGAWSPQRSRKEAAFSAQLRELGDDMPASFAPPADAHAQDKVLQVTPLDTLLVRPTDLVGFDRLTILYEHSAGPSLLWLKSIEVEFGIASEDVELERTDSQ